MKLRQLWMIEETRAGGYGGQRASSSCSEHGGTSWVDYIKSLERLTGVFSSGLCRAEILEKSE